GAEANECAIKLARLAGGPGKHVVISAFGSFHGRTLATLHATGQPAKHEKFQPLPEGFHHVAAFDVNDLERNIDATTAAVLIEVVQGEGGVNPAPDGYVRDVRALCDDRGVLLIVDEIQTGLGRTGEWFAFQHSDIRPDIVTVAKALGNGMPIGACWARNEVASVFEPGDHGSTYGGQPLATAAARATLQELIAIDAPACARAAGERLTKGLESLSGVAGVRGLGLLLGAELTAGNAKAVNAALLDAGLVVNAVTDTALRFAPPLNVSDDEINQALAICAEVIE
ncbi:MAG: acetylornithine/N-succinyldiaminopimelate aminotransferase, partial [Actinomycetota bacterium]